MEEYGDIENNAVAAGDSPGAYDATSATMNRQEDEYQTQHQRGAEEERNQSVKLGVFKATSGNGTKRIKMRQESRVTTRSGKSAEAVIKQFASQELQGEKEKMQAWKENVMQEVARGLQVIRQVQEEAIEAQRQNFQVELVRVEKVWEMRSKSLEYEIRLLKNPNQHLAQKKPASKRTQMTSDNKQVDGRVDKLVNKQAEEPAKEGEPVEEEGVVPSQNQARKARTFISNSGTKKHTTEKQSYASIAVSRLSEVSEHP